ncbi:hypothetical protein COTS27_00555 [Spirochaetota bacterium]|nr:hypothetical protein COTS27_00555 [Spirochaetota bacterium]
MHNNSSKIKESSIKESLVNLRTLQFSTVGRMIVCKRYNFQQAKSGFMLKDKDKDILVRSSLVLRKVADKEKIKKDSTGVIHKLSNYPSPIKRLVKSSSNDDFNCNIQHLKLKEFNVLYYLLFFYDIIEIFKVNSNDITNIPTYSLTQLKDKPDVSRFHIDRESYNNYHKQNSTNNRVSHNKVRYDKLNKYLK